jgi:hypothetical protein
VKKERRRIKGLLKIYWRLSDDLLETGFCASADAHDFVCRRKEKAHAELVLRELYH